MHSRNNKSNKTYLYIISSRREFNDLCAMEMKYIFGETIRESYYITSKLIDISRSVFIKQRVSIDYQNEDIDVIENEMLEDQLDYNNYKFHYHKIDQVPYQTRLDNMRKLGFTIPGDFAIKDPEVEFLLTKIKGIWIFGLLEENPNLWLNRVKKPHSYSHALDIKIARAAINIGIANDLRLKLIDPCCGIGTVLLEARSMGIDINGYELNPLIKEKCNKNLVHFGFNGDVIKQDVLETSRQYDISILDLPYGKSSIITLKEQLKLVKKSTEISNKSIIIAMSDMRLDFENIDLEILDFCRIEKTNVFSRYIIVCK